MAKILDIMDAEMSKLEDGDGADFDLLVSIMDYCLQYPDRYHHPLEDMVLRQLRQRDPESADKVGDLEKSHRDLTALTKRLNTALENIAGGAEISRQSIGALTQEFLSTYRFHIEMEETGFFPAASAKLTARDWQLIEKEMAPGDDPLFAAREAADLAELRREILRWNEPASPA